MFKPVSPRVDFPKLERELLKKWYKEGIVDKYLHKNDRSKKKFSFLDGPITANNPMGIHHGWGRTYKDLWQRYFNMRGFRQRFQNGFDEQGLWVEVEVEKELGLKSKKEIENLIPGDTFASLEKFVNLCKQRVKKYSKVQTEQSKRLGYFMDWDNSYHTSSDENNYAIWHFLKVVHEKGWLYKGRDSVPWCPRCGTGISQHEILTEEYNELTHRTVVFKLPIKGKDKEYLLAWTTTPWTVPGNVALAVDPKLSYWKMTNNRGEKIIIVNPTVSWDLEKEAMLVNRLGLVDGWVKRPGGEIKGSELVGLEYEGPYDDLPAVKKALSSYKHRVVAADPQILAVDPGEGTGIVHVAPGAGSEDFQLGKKEKLSVIEEIDEEGVFLDGFGFMSGLYVKEAMPKILEDLERRGLVFKVFDYTHRYPTCWRCKSELVWRVVDEWYIAMDRPSSANGRTSEDKQTYREQMVEVAKKINWIPKWGLERELDWLKNMHDWFISKKRYWGLALPIWECKKCGSFDVVGGREELQRRVVEGWDKFEGHSPHRPWIDQIKIACSKCGQVSARIPDVGNPWLDAGIVTFSTMPPDWFPADFITESFPGQFKNWFYSLIAMATALKKANPFRTVLGFATMVDERGEAFHKSKGNAIEFVEGADKAGADVIRWVCTRANPEQNVLFGYHIADAVRKQFFLMLWNVYNFFVNYAIIDKWQLEDKRYESKHVLDTWILSRLHNTINIVTTVLQNYNAKAAALSIEEFVADLSLWYVRRSRDRVGPTAEDGEDKKACHATLYEVLVNLTKLLAPFTPFVVDEMYTNLTGEESVHLVDWPEYDQKLINKQLEEQMMLGRKLVQAGHSLRKEKKIKTRQPLSLAWHTEPKQKITNVDALQQVLQELNIKEWIHEDNFDKFVKKKSVVGKEIDGCIVYMDTDITPDLKIEGDAREIIRTIQEERKKLGTRLDEKVKVVLPSWPKEFEDEIRRKALVRTLEKGKLFRVERV